MYMCSQIPCMTGLLWGAVQCRSSGEGSVEPGVFRSGPASGLPSPGQPSLDILPRIGADAQVCCPGPSHTAWHAELLPSQEPSASSSGVPPAMAIAYSPQLSV
jgi:hypothetical protein